VLQETSLAGPRSLEADRPWRSGRSTAKAVWQRRYYDFNIFTEAKLDEKLEYMHMNPVRAGLVEKAIDWPWSSARFYLLGRPVGVPVRYIA
jgi:putative transposase